jgi:hypothetical protein
MSLFDQLGQAVGGMLGGGGNQNPLLQAVVGMLSQNSSSGGLAGLVQTLQKNGLTDIVNSWVGTGQNLPVSAQQIKQGLGGDLLNRWRPRPASHRMRQAHSWRTCFLDWWISLRRMERLKRLDSIS